MSITIHLWNKRMNHFKIKVPDDRHFTCAKVVKRDGKIVIHQEAD